eukprot:1340756-Prymnesium_polylepis.1
MRAGSSSGHFRCKKSLETGYTCTRWPPPSLGPWRGGGRLEARVPLVVSSVRLCVYRRVYYAD